MPRKRESLKYALNKRAFQNTKNSKNNNTETSYKRSINQFVEWAKKRGYKTVNEVTKETIQEYEEFLEGHPKSYQPSTIHTFLTPICVATGVSMHEIRKPKRTAGKIVRSRNKGTDDNKCKNSQGLREECDPKYARVVSFQRAVSIRRAELADLVGMDLIYMGEDWSVLVRHGKGGKRSCSVSFHRMLIQYVRSLTALKTRKKCSVKRNSITRSIFTVCGQKMPEDATHTMRKRSKQS